VPPDAEPPHILEGSAQAPPAPRHKHHAWHLPGHARWASVIGALAALVVVAAPFLEWMHVRPAEADRFGRALAEAARAEPPGAGSAGFHALGRKLERAHALTGLDLVQWSREARARLGDPRSADASDERTRERIVRIWTVVAAIVLGLTGLAALLACYILWHRFARFRPSLQVVAGVTAGLALGVAGALSFLWRPFQGLITPGPGHLALLVGGAGLLVALVGTVRVMHLLGVLLATGLTLAALIALAWVYAGGQGL
jgi:hypothetical protein